MAGFSVLILLALVIIFGYVIRLAIYKIGGFNRRIYNVTIKVVLAVLVVVTGATIFLAEPVAPEGVVVDDEQIREFQYQWHLFFDTIKEQRFVDTDQIAGVNRLETWEFEYNGEQLNIQDRLNNHVNVWVLEPSAQLQNTIRATYYSGTMVVGNREVTSAAVAPSLELVGDTLFVTKHDIRIERVAVALEYPIAQFINKDYSMYARGSDWSMVMGQNVLVLEVPEGLALIY